MRIVLRDFALQEQLLRDGFLRIPDFLCSQELASLRDAYQSYDPGISSKYYSTIDSYDAAYKRHVNQAIRQAAARSVEHYLQDYRPLTGNFVIKRKGRKSKVFMHFDISCVDEREAESCVLWLPLADVGRENGVLQMLRGSHTFMNPVRGPGVKRFYESLYDEFEKSWMEPVPMRAGDGLIFFNRILHYSAPNTVSETRVGARIDLIPAEWKALMYFWRKGIPEDMVAVYAIEDDFYEHFRKEQEPVGATLLGFQPNVFEPWPAGRVREFLQARRLNPV
jgi:hypothetical protein